MADGTINIDTMIDGDGAEQGLQALQGRLEATGKKMQSLGQGMTAGLTAPIVAVGGMALKTASDFESANGKMQAQLGLTAGETEKYGEIAKTMWKNAFGENIGDVTQSIATVKQNLGDLNDADLQKVTEGALTIRDVFEEDVAASTSTAKVMMENFGVSATDSMDLMTVGMQKGGNFSGELLDTMREYSPVFSTMGHSAEDMMNILISGAEAGAFNMDKVGDAMKEFGIRAKDGSDTTAEGFAAIGMDAEEMGAKIAAGGKEGEAAFQATVAGLAAMEDPVARNAAGVALFGSQWEDLESDVISAMANGTNHVEGFEGATARAGEAAYDTFGSRLTTAWRTAQESLIPLGEIMLSLAEKFIPPLIAVITSLAEWFAGLSSEFQLGIVIFSGVVAAIGPLLVVLGTIVGAIAPLLPAIAKAWSLLMKLKNVFTVIRTAMMILTGPIGIITAIIVGLGIIIYKNWDAIKAKTIEVWNGIAAFLPILWAGIKAGASVFLEFLKTLFNTGLTFVVTLFKTIWGGLVAIASGVWQAIVLAVTVAINTLKLVVTTVLTGIAAFFSAVWNGIKAVALTVWSLIVAGVTLYIKAVQMIVTTVFNAVKSFITTVFNGIKTVAITVWNAIKSAISTAINAIKSTVISVFNAIKSAVTSVLNGIKSVAVSVWNAIKSAITTAVNAIKSTVTNVFNAIKSFISNTFNAIKSTISNVWNAIKTVVSNATNSIKSTVTKVFNGLKSAVSTAMNNVKTAVSSGWDKVKSFLSGIDLTQMGKNIIQGLIGGIKSMAGKLLESAKGVVDGAIDGAKALLGIKSPSRVFMQIGKFTGEGMEIGLNRSAKDVGRAGENMAAAAIPRVKAPAAAPGSRYADGAARSETVNNHNNPVTVHLEYNGSGGQQDAREMVDFLERELAKRHVSAAYNRGVRA